MIYWPFIESLALLLFLKIPVLDVLGKGLWKQSFSASSGAFSKSGVQGLLRGWELVSSPQWGPWSAGWHRSSLHPPARKLRKHYFMCVFWKEASGQWLPHTPWKHLKLWMESLTRCTSDPTNTHTHFSSACCLSLMLLLSFAVTNRSLHRAPQP